MTISLEELDAHIEDLEYQLAHAQHKRRELVLQQLEHWEDSASVEKVWGTLFAFLESRC